MSILKEFKEFAVRGNVIDLAVGIIVGGAFQKVVSSVVSDVVMPPIGLMIGGVDFSDLVVTLKSASAPGATDGVFLYYGKFIQTIFDFTIVAFAVFLLVKAINTLKRTAAPPPTPPTKQEELLIQIRDILKAK